MGLNELDIKLEYRSLRQNVARDFLIPCLRKAISYDRAVGFFSSTSLADISYGIEGLSLNNGRIRLIASPKLSDEDAEAINQGYVDREKLIADALNIELRSPTNHFEKERLNLLANLIKDGIVDIKIALLEHNKEIGIYHEKLGIIRDEDDNTIAFSGSMNESDTAFKINYETIDVYCSWMSDESRERIRIKRNAFDSIWEDSESGIQVIDFPIAVKERLVSTYYYSDVDYDNVPIPEYIDDKVEAKPAIGARVPDEFKFHDYQIEAISEWVKNGHRGIFDMATGTGKTYTGLGAVAALNTECKGRLAVFIVCPYQHLVEQWVQDIKLFSMNPIIGYSASPQKEWKKRLSDAIRDQKIRKDRSFFCFVTTNATFASGFVQEQINKIKMPILLVADEAHNFGAPSYTRCLDDRFTYRLALSATLDRHHDEEGTSYLYNFFGKKCIEYPLSRAIDEDKLTPYKYYPVLVHLNDEELPHYEELSYEISKCLIKGKNGKWKLNKQGEILALKRSRIVAGASEKLNVLREVMLPYIKDNNILVYCGATNVIDEKSDHSYTDEADVRQIEAVINILGNELGMAVSKFTADEDMETRAMIIDQFQKKEKLQAIVAIKCLDEGVNIPGIRTAFILASTTNPKEYIQRRGRVLRKAKNKDFAEIYDFVTLPRELDTVASLTEEQAKRDLSLVKNELVRIKEFGRLSMNPMDAETLIWNIQDAYNIIGDEPNEEEL